MCHAWPACCWRRWTPWWRSLKAGLQAQARERLQQHGVADLHSAVASLALDIELNAQGLGVWLDRATR